ncbi:MAG: DUF2612 domain-containing protein [Clostridia bacterium]|nr:DUF2612 domain-containing protein [Clostridia bacterium]
MPELTLSNYLSLFSPAHQGKPRFMALASAALSQAADLLTLLQSAFPEARTIDTATGSALDALGALLDVTRPASASDEDYRFLLRARIAARQWNGTNEGLPDVLAAALPRLNAACNDNADGSVTITLSGNPPFPLRDLIPVPAGVRLIQSEGETEPD